MFSEELYLTTATAKTLYEKFAKDLPIIDFHCHLSPREIHDDRRFSNIGELWLSGDHYKWRAMRAFGIDERYVTGDAGWYEKFREFAKILPMLAGNPLYIWCALELKRYFGIDEPLCEANAKEIYDRTLEMINERDIKPSYIIKQSNVEFIATTDDPADELVYHAKIGENRTLGNCHVVPAFRPDKALNIEKPGFADYIASLGRAAGMEITSFADLIKALERRLKAFKSLGSTLDDNAVSGFEWEDYTEAQVEAVFKKGIKAMQASPKAAKKITLKRKELARYRSAFLYEVSRLYAKHGFVTQYHIGAYRNANSVMMDRLGPDTGYDCVDEAASVRAFGALFDRLNNAGALPRIILYPLDINQGEAFAALAASFCGQGRGQVQLGAPWWFNDQFYGITRQFESVGSLYPVALSVGMLTDSRSFLSYPRHELYRRALCNYLGALVERHEYFSGEEALGALIHDVCYGNAKRLFGL